ncbi:MAG TPA: hypothetical protein VK548_12570 [Candidatus Acidoferrum sp.]|nr:hypothetical protein [Candidatus Acidoferrum sp.]
MTGLPLLVVQHPLGGEQPESVVRRAHQAVEQLLALLGTAPAEDAPAHRMDTQAEHALTHAAAVSRESRSIEVDPEDVLAEFAAREWCDGLPVVAPTEARVSEMLGGRDGARSLGAVPPLWRQATLEKLAVNAVMAGCEPAYFPVVVAAVEAMLDPSFNCYGVQATTHPVAPLVIVHGPRARAIGVHGGSGCLGPGFRANATIGRAIRLIMLNVGGAWPGRHDMATQGSPSKFSYCLAENVEASPWGPWREDDSVTVFGGEPPHNVNDHVSTTASGILTTVAKTAVAPGSNVGWILSQSQLLVVLGPEHAATIAGDGLSRADVQRFVYEHARLPLSTLKLGGMWGMHDWPAWMHAVRDGHALMPAVASTDDIFVIVAGGHGKHSAVIPNCAFSRAVTMTID